MPKTARDKIHAKGIDIGIYTKDFENEYISLTDIAKYKSDDPTALIQNWMRNRDVIEFLGLWEGLHNQGFKPLEFEGFRNQAGLNKDHWGRSYRSQKMNLVKMIMRNRKKSIQIKILMI